MIMESEKRQFRLVRGTITDTNTVKHNVTDLINELPGNSPVNTVYYATIEAVFSMSSAPSNSWNGVLCDQLLSYAKVLTRELLCMWSVPRLCNEIPRITKAVTVQVTRLPF
jgi:hypothetical protein